MTVHESEALRRLYLFGMCGVLAVTLHNRRGFPIVGIFTPFWNTVPVHIGVVTPRGFGDARGFDLSLADFLRGYDAPGHRIAKISCEYVVRRFRRDDIHYERCLSDLDLLGLSGA